MKKLNVRCLNKYKKKEKKHIVSSPNSKDIVRIVASKYRIKFKHPIAVFKTLRSLPYLSYP